MKEKEKTFTKKIGYISLGCDKNRVDTENVITLLTKYGFVTEPDAAKADIIIINTCAYLKEARDEATSTIKEMLEYKKQKLEKLIVLGCYVQLDKNGLLRKPADGGGLAITNLGEIAGIDAFVEPKDYDDLPEIIYGLYNKKFAAAEKLPDYRQITTPPHYAYLKIADGCSNYCAYCKIPYIKGEYKSIPIQDLTATAKTLAKQGVKELIIVAQDITRYGLDLYKKPSLVRLLGELSKIEGIQWLRLLYCYPEMLDPLLVKEIAQNDKIVKYIDVPFQHVSTPLLKSMNRRGNEQSVRFIIEFLRHQIPGIAIRTTFIVGFPGETKKDFRLLKRVLKEYKLENVGFFTYSREEGTPSYDLPKQISEKTKQKRLAKLQNIQQKIALKNNMSIIGTEQKVLCDGYDAENELYYGRNYAMAPDVDFIIYFSGENVKAGEFVSVKITDATEEYLLGEKV